MQFRVSDKRIVRVRCALSWNLPTKYSWVLLDMVSDFSMSAWQVIALVGHAVYKAANKICKFQLCKCDSNSCKRLKIRLVASRQRKAGWNLKNCPKMQDYFCQSLKILDASVICIYDLSILSNAILSWRLLYLGFMKPYQYVKTYTKTHL